MQSTPGSETAVEQKVLEFGIPSFCLTYTRDVSSDELMQRLGASSADAAPLTLAEADSLVDYESEGTLLRVGMLGNWAFCFETWGILGAGGYGLSRMSAGTETLSYLSGGNGVDLVQNWVNSEPVEIFEPMAIGSLRARDEHPLWDDAQRYRSELGDPNLTPIAGISALKAIHDRVGVAITLELIRHQPLPSIWLPESPAMRLEVPHLLPQVVRQGPSRGPGRYLGTL
ncbi:DUF6461 domain-containing protein [[Kitasatospora] papulosa]|uniref:DUF6461 domain-containing protein n=1 Tax=[Kitasatospora] papulosa TaxID=1464011 RepID=UPI00338DC702